MLSNSMMHMGFNYWVRDLSYVHQATIRRVFIYVGLGTLKYH